MPAQGQSAAERHIQVLGAFVLRARRVEAHSLASDVEALWKVSAVEMVIEVTREATFIRQTFPPEEQVESAAARVRPILLETEEVYHRKVMNALGFFARDAGAELIEKIAALRREWTRIQPRGTNVLGSSVQMEHPDGTRSDFLSDTQLAFAWIYGDVVHNDSERLAATEMHGVEGRFKAAAPIVARLMLLTISTLNATRKLRTLGLIELPDALFEAEVVVRETTFRSRANVWTAPLGTPIPDHLRPPPTEG
ncbi:hypothetical protein BWO91_17630 [Plantibacter flavus]|nr:hypothetical protein BWO91_17630 [Plantibacter flavus]